MSDQPMPPPKSRQDLKRQQEAEEILRRVRLDSESIGSSALSRHDPVASDSDDDIEIWGRRIGRSLGVIAVLIILWELVMMLFTGK